MSLSNTQTAELKAIVEPYRRALYHGDVAQAQTDFAAAVVPDAPIHLAHPFNTLNGVSEFLTQALLPLANALHGIERRDTIVMAGESHAGNMWVGCCGYYTGISDKAFLDIPPTGHQASLRFHEFYKIDNGKVVEIQALWDIPELMLQASAWPMMPALGREWHVPGPATQDGLAIQDHQLTQSSIDLVVAMLEGLGRYADGGVEAMQLDQYWHPHFSWYGPSGIGTARGVQGFRDWHQKPFLKAMPNRVGSIDGNDILGEGHYVAFTGWPGMSATISADGWLGIKANNQSITMRSLDFWRCEGTLIRENWVLVDLLHVFDQVGIDVLARMRDKIES